MIRGPTAFRLALAELAHHLWALQTSGVGDGSFCQVKPVLMELDNGPPQVVGPVIYVGSTGDG